ncbi:unnamed protein product [Effrenium voratum]|nr:unnamed protein product [Effrenium voratum]
MATTGLEPLLEQQISVVTNDGRLFVGVLRGFDQSSNVVLSDCQERVFDTDKGVEQVVLGLYVIRGDNLAVVGEVDEEIDSRIDLSPAWRSLHPVFPVQRCPCNLIDWKSMDSTVFQLDSKTLPVPSSFVFRK